MLWQFRLTVQDASGGPVHDAQLELRTWTGSGDVNVAAPVLIGETHAFTTADEIINIVVSLLHPRYAPLTLNLVRSPGEPAWRWTDPRWRIVTSGKDVSIVAVLLRVRGAPTLHLPEPDLQRRAEAAKAPQDARARARKQPLPVAVRIDSLPGALRDPDANYYRHLGGAPISSFHRMDVDPLGDKNARGWGRFRSIRGPVDPSRNSRVHLIEYGEVGPGGARGPRFLVAVWLPHALARVGRSSMDFLVWFTPITQPPNYLTVSPPFHGDYPYALMARGTQPAYEAVQTYVLLPFTHLMNQHFLAYQMLAAKRAAAIVIPIAPAVAHFELWESPSTLMRMLKEICRWIPRDDDGRFPKLHPPPPTLGRIGVAGFSAGGLRLNALLDRRGPALHYVDPIWGTRRDADDFERAWSELWAVDPFLGLNPALFPALVEKAARWTRQGDRRLCIYKSAHTGTWDPRSVSTGEFGRAMKAATHEERGCLGEKLWAISSVEPGGRIRAVSVSDAYAEEPGAQEEPKLRKEGKEGAHENMPRLFVGHAAVTSGFARLED